MSLKEENKELRKALKALYREVSEMADDLSRSPILSDQVLARGWKALLIKPAKLLVKE